MCSAVQQWLLENQKQLVVACKSPGFSSWVNLRPLFSADSPSNDLGIQADIPGSHPKAFKKVTSLHPKSSNSLKLSWNNLTPQKNILSNNLAKTKKLFQGSFQNIVAQDVSFVYTFLYCIPWYLEIQNQCAKGFFMLSYIPQKESVFRLCCHVTFLSIYLCLSVHKH